MNIEKNHRIEQILTSLDNHPKAGAPDFFFTRLKARMEKGLEKKAERPWILRPAFAMLALVLVLAINAAVLLGTDEKTDNNSATDTDSIQSIASEYSLNDNNIMYDLTLEK